MLQIGCEKGLEIDWLTEFQQKAEMAQNLSGLGDKLIEVFFCQAKLIRKANKKYRSKDKATDVLSWFYGDSFGCYGEVALCLKKIEEQASENGWGAQTEAIRLFVHGLAHIQGYDHEKTKDEAKMMLSYEKDLLAKLGINGIYNGINKK